jgi:hypothetical protein
MDQYTTKPRVETERLKQAVCAESAPEVREVFWKIVAGCATLDERQRYLTIWKHSTSWREAKGSAELSDVSNARRRKRPHRAAHPSAYSRTLEGQK